ncbi:MAG: AMP-binding protein [Rhizomicrobium sp.]
MTAPISLASLPSRHAAAKPAAPAVTCGARTLTWHELDSRTNRIAHALQNAGVRFGDLVTIALPNGTDFIEACFALWKIGATPQPVSARLPKSELDGIIALAKPPLVIADPQMVIDGKRASISELLDRSDDVSPLPDRIAPAWKAPTSGGSTGRPKLIVSGQTAIAQPESVTGWRLDSESVALMPGPLYHNGPFVTAFCALMAGAHLVILPRFDAETVLQQIATNGATWIYLVPTMMSRIWRLPRETRERYAVSTLKTVWHLAAPCPPWLKEAWIEWLGADTIWELYAGTEGQAGTVITGSEWLQHRGSVGKPFTGQLRILDEAGNDVPAGTVGEVFMRRAEGLPPSYRYIGAEARARGDWESLGDMGHVDAEGYLYLADRRSDMILVGGSNVYPAEVEAVLDEHPLVASSAVIGLPDEDLGARVHAIVQPRPGLDIDELRSFLSGRLLAYKCPRTFELMNNALRDDAGKVRRSQLREERLAGKGL